MDNVNVDARRSFEAFNARFLTLEEVAHTFIPPSQYFRLIEGNHSVIFGPRGSGKTTLLKMLQLRALAAWESPKAATLRNSLSFHSVFLGTDVLWGSQLDARCSKLRVPELGRIVRRASFRLHLYAAILNAVEEAQSEQINNCRELRRFSFSLEPERQARLVDALSDVWQLTPRTSSLLGLRVAIRSEISKLHAVVETLDEGGVESVPSNQLLDPMQSALGAIDVINHVIGQPDRRWAILCDELEIAPDIIREDLFSLLRSTFQNVIFKFSLFPHSSETVSDGGAVSPSANNDYEPLNLSYPYRRDAFKFCEELLSGMVRNSGYSKPVTPVEVLGDGWFDGSGFGSDIRPKEGPYRAPNGAIYKRAVKLRKNDRSFGKWLASRSFKLEQVDNLPEERKAQFRKATPFILTRSEFLGPDRSLRSRKSFNLYTGAYSLFSISEGNPRIFINLMRPLIREFCSTMGTVKDNSQTSSIESTIHRYKASLSALPTTGAGEIRSILQLVSVIGKYLEMEQIREDFSSEPPSTIILDDAVPSGILSLVTSALNSGALVRMPNEAKASGRQPNLAESIVGARVRLAYTLAPEFKLPLVTTRAISLSTVLHAVRVSETRQPDLFGLAKISFHSDEGYE